MCFDETRKSANLIRDVTNLSELKIFTLIFQIPLKSYFYMEYNVIFNSKITNDHSLITNKF